MGKVVLIEPHKVLQQAIALSLFPEHDVRVEVSVTASAIGALRDVDLLIVDAGALRASDKLSPEFSRAVESSLIPTLWIDEDQTARPSRRDKLVAITKPIESKAFQAAVTELLSPASAGKERQKAASPVEPKAEKVKASEKKALVAKSEPSEPEAELIELVEVVGEDAPPAENRKAPKKADS